MSNNHTTRTAVEVFLDDLKRQIEIDKSFISDTLSNVFTMREFGNKTHGDLAEVALVEFINRNMKGYSAEHVGKSLFRAKRSEEDISIISPKGDTFALSLKAYGIGPLQLSTNKDSSMFNLLSNEIGNRSLEDQQAIKSILSNPSFSDFFQINVLPLIYDEKKGRFNITVFDSKLAYDAVERISYETPQESSKRKHPVYRFYGKGNQYIMEVRYGGVDANALQRGLWTHTVNGRLFFRDITGWQSYSINKQLLLMIPKLLNFSETDHAKIVDFMSSFLDKD